MSSSDPRLLRIADYTYDLPEDRIARYPLPRRDASKLLVYEQGIIRDDTFDSLARHLPKGSLLVLNDAKVVRARMIFQKPSGGSIEIFCLEPHASYPDITTAMAAQGNVLWNCLVGGAAKWKNNISLTLTAGAIRLRAQIASRNNGHFTIRFEWTPAKPSFAEVLEAAGKIPLPPYLGRAAEEQDDSRYQTMFAVNAGSVAAPTASLHFTPELLESVKNGGVELARLTLHVGAGTFMPVKSAMAGGHNMHHEWIDVSKAVIQRLLKQTGKPVIAAGTTALRTLESLYWMGTKVIEMPSTRPDELGIGQWEPYGEHLTIGRDRALQALIDWMDLCGVERVLSQTGIMIAPGYTFRVVDGLITNFHQPQSTLLLLVAAFIGEDWLRVYGHALANGYRFLSYGDGSLLWRSQ